MLEQLIISNSESERFLSNVQKLKKLKSNQLNSLNIEVRNKKLEKKSKNRSIF